MRGTSVPCRHASHVARVNVDDESFKMNQSINQSINHDADDDLDDDLDVNAVD